MFEVADAMRLAAGALDQHDLAHHGRARGGARDKPAAIENLAHQPFDRRVADLARYAQLVAAGEEKIPAASRNGARIPSRWLSARSVT